MINTKSLRSEYSIIRKQASRDAVIGGVILAILGGLTIALIVRGFCLLIVVIKNGGF